MKILLSNKTDFDNFISIYTMVDDPFRGRLDSCLGEPEQYPCVVVFEIKVDDNGPDYIDGEFVYFDDFEYDFEKNFNI
jgi:hypothetical protein